MLSWRFPWNPPWRCARWMCLVLAAALAAGACGLDDRKLSDAKLLDSSTNPGQIECGVAGDNPCETCLYAECCDQARACGLGSQCASYVACVAACNSDTACRSHCITQYPSGYGDDVALGICGEAHCGICSDQAATQSCDPSGAGACQNPNDCAALEADAPQDLDCPACEADLRGAACQRCLSQQTGLSPACSSCVTAWLACRVDNCLAPCQSGSNPQACSSCMSAAGCTQQLASCGFGG